MPLALSFLLVPLMPAQGGLGGDDVTISIVGVRRGQSAPVTPYARTRRAIQGV